MQHRVAAGLPAKVGKGRVALAMSSVALALLVTGCAKPKPDVVGSITDDYRVAHPISYSEMLETMDVPVGIDMVRLPGPMKGTVAGFGQQFIGSGSGVIAIVTPLGSPNQSAAANIGREVRDQLIASGVGAREIEFRHYTADLGEPGAPVRIAYNRMTARTEPCEPWTDNFVRSPDNAHYNNYGCATQQNLAAAVANPLDLMYPRGTTPADAGRRSTVLDAYRKGGATQSDYSKENGGTVATGVGN